MDNATPARSSTAATEFDRQSVSEEVITAVAQATGTTPVDLTPPLFSVIDPEALDSFVESIRDESPEGIGRIEFTYCGCTVTVTADGRVIATEEESA